jgi:hypothetical protein
MKLLFVIYSGPSPEHVTELLERHHSPGFTILEGGTGMGQTGRLEGTRAWPGTATIVLSILDDRAIVPLRDALRAYRDKQSPGEHLHVATVPIEDYF